jgi:hypothetical protein
MANSFPLDLEGIWSNYYRVKMQYDGFQGFDESELISPVIVVIYPRVVDM